MAALLLRDSYHLIALDQRGHGDTDWTANVEDDTGALMVEDTRAFLDHLASERGVERLSLVGMSMGGINSFSTPRSIRSGSTPWPSSTSRPR